MGFCECGCGRVVEPGKQFVRGHHRRGKFLPFAEARTMARNLGFKSVADYQKNRPANLPSNPNETYKGEWTS
jgi:hypothetical protein